jgi:uncharacterized membrane protein
VITTLARLALGVFLLVAGVGHFVGTQEFTAQVPPWMPAPEFVVYASGVIEIALGLALIIMQRHRAVLGWIVAAFFVVIFPGNVWQFIEARDAFGLDSDAARAVRLIFQPVLVVWALWCTGAWTAAREARRARSASS